MTEYSFKMYLNGKVILETDPMTLEQARKYYKANYSTNNALRLFVNGEKIPYAQIPKVLRLSKLECFNTYDVSLVPRTVRG